MTKIKKRKAFEGVLFNIDFDGTCVAHEFPKIGRDIGAVPVLEYIVNNGGKIILFTCRSDAYLRDAVMWFHERGIPLYGINENPTQKAWTSSPKPYAQHLIDDSAMGAPLTQGPTDDRPFIDWKKVEEFLFKLDATR